MILGEVRAVCRDSGTQWMIFVCSGIYLVMFTWLGTLRASRQIILRLSNPDVWLLAFLLIASCVYALNYGTAVASFQALLLIFGAAFGKGVALWVGWKGKSSDKVRVTQSIGWRIQFLLAVVVLLLAGAALWQPEAYGMTYQYRGVPRWRGVWDNPNIYGVLMAVGTVLSAGLLVHAFFPGSGRALPQGNMSRAAGQSDSEGNRFWTIVRCVWFLLLVVAAGLCAFGLVRSLSRGAFLAAVAGIVWLIWRYGKSLHEFAWELHGQGPSGECARDLECADMSALGTGRHVAQSESGDTSPHSKTAAAHGTDARKSQSSTWPVVTWCHSNRIALCVILVSALMISFWQFRHTEHPLARRLFSVGNVNDFSWRNRVTAWQGTLKMMADRPLLGFGWGKAEEAFSNDYRSRRLDETAAIQMNDYLMLGASAGVPALVCFGLYLGLGLRRNDFVAGWSSSAQVQSGSVPSDSKGAFWRRIWGCAAAQPYRHLVGRSCRSATSPSELLAAEQSLRFDPSSIAQAGAVVLLVAFWFDGGLFKLPSAVVFWTLFELGRMESDMIKQTAVRRSALAETTKQKLGTQHRSGTILRWTAVVIGLVAAGLTAIHLGTPRLHINERTVAIARKFLVQPGQMADFNFLTAGNSVVNSAGSLGANEMGTIWRGKKLKTLLDHVQLADYNRQLVAWKVDDETYRLFVLSPLIHPEFDGAMNWRRPLWEHFYPRVRRENDLRLAAEIIAKDLIQHVRIRADQDSPAEIKTMWEQGETSPAGSEALYVAALRSAGIPARLDEQGKVELFSDSKWHPAPRPVFEAVSTDQSTAP